MAGVIDRMAMATLLVHVDANGGVTESSSTVSAIIPSVAAPVVVAP